MVVNEPESCREALENYCSLMDDWVAAVRSGGDLNTVFPVDAAATLRNADDLSGRLGFVRKEIIPTSPTDPILWL